MVSVTHQRTCPAACWPAATARRRCSKNGPKVLPVPTGAPGS